MEKILRYVRKHKLLVLLVILVIILIIFCAKLIFIFTDSDEVAIYGSRLETEDKVEIDEESTGKEVKEKLGDEVDDVTFRVQGRLLNITYNVKADVSRDTAKGLTSKVLEALSDKAKSYFDIQVFVTKTEEAEETKQFPIIGYKHHTEDGFTWTKDR